MSWKPSRSNGIMFDKFSLKSDNHRKSYFDMIESGDYLKFENIKRLSKHLYLYWLNENKKHSALISRSVENFYPLEECAVYPSILPMLRRNINLVYKPMQKHIC